MIRCRVRDPPGRYLKVFFLPACADADSEPPHVRPAVQEYDWVSSHWPLDAPGPDARVCSVLGTGVEIRPDLDPILTMDDFEAGPQEEPPSPSVTTGPPRRRVRTNQRPLRAGAPMRAPARPAYSCSTPRSGDP